MADDKIDPAIDPAAVRMALEHPRDCFYSKGETDYIVQQSSTCKEGEVARCASIL
jgi:hypothetical protein